MDVFKVISVEKADHRGTEFWGFRMERPDGNIHMHFIPDDAVEWRAAEYGIDPEEGIDMILMMLLQERHLPDLTTEDGIKQDPAFKAGFVVDNLDQRSVLGIGDSAPVTLFNTNDVALARDAQMVRIAHIEANVARYVVHEEATEDPFEKFKTEYQIDHDLVRMASQHLKEVRARTIESNRAKALLASIGRVTVDKTERYRGAFERRGI